MPDWTVRTMAPVSSVMPMSAAMRGEVDTINVACAKSGAAENKKDQRHTALTLALLQFMAMPPVLFASDVYCQESVSFREIVALLPGGCPLGSGSVINSSSTASSVSPLTLTR